LHQCGCDSSLSRPALVFLMRMANAHVFKVYVASYRNC
jgi:hypothetical protein